MSDQKFVTGHQPHYLPWIRYVHKIWSADQFCLVDMVQYEKKYFQNRTRIRTKNGEVFLVVPVKTSGKFTQTICDVEIDNTQPWRKKHWKSIALAYGRAPHFSLYADFFEDVYAREWKLLIDLDEYLLRGILRFTGIKRDIVRASTLGVSGQKTDILIDICRKTGADGYLSGMGGARQYVDVGRLEREGLLHRFQEFVHPTYPQFHGGSFVPNLSIIDLLFNCGPESGRIVKSASPTGESLT